jgi:hypothetical protein
MLKHTVAYRQKVFAFILLGLSAVMLVVLMLSSNGVSTPVSEMNDSNTAKNLENLGNLNASASNDLWLKDSILFILPLAPKHFSFAAENWLPFFLSEQSLENVHLLIVFSTHDESTQFRKSYNLDVNLNPPGKIFYAVYADTFPFDTHPTGSVVTLKKWFGIKHARLATSYEFYIPMDTEAIFLKPIDMYFLKTLRARNSFIGDVQPHGLAVRIVDSIKNWLLQRDPNVSLLEAFERPFFFWYSDVPFYREQDLDGFFNFIRYEETSEFAASIKWEYFDHLVYGFYLMHAKGFRPIYTSDIGFNIGWSLELEYNPFRFKQYYITHIDISFTIDHYG